MTNFFDPIQFKGYPACPHRCGGCQKFWHECTAPAELVREFASMVGLDWTALSGPDKELVFINFRKDYASLGLDTTDIPDQLFLCLPCMLDYMKSFNHLGEEEKRPKQG